jgi:hypothetical protein
VAGGRFDKANRLFIDPGQQSSDLNVMTEGKLETSVEAKKATGQLNRLMPQLVRQVTE